MVVLLVWYYIGYIPRYVAGLFNGNTCKKTCRFVRCFNFFSIYSYRTSAQALCVEYFLV